MGTAMKNSLPDHLSDAFMTAFGNSGMIDLNKFMDKN